MFDCKPACCGNSDPVSDTVKVDASRLAAGKENAKPIQLQNKEAEDKKRAQEEALRKQKEREEEERRQALEENRKRRQEEDDRRRREEQEARNRAAEAAKREAEAAAAAEAEEQRRLQAEQELMEEQQRARQEREAAERAAQLAAQKKEEERLALDKVNAWCKTNGFVNMATQKKSFINGTRFPIHDAVTKNDAEIVGLMLQLGVDKSVKNSKGKTAADIAHKLNKNGSMDAVISKLNGNFP